MDGIRPAAQPFWPPTTLVPFAALATFASGFSSRAASGGGSVPTPKVETFAYDALNHLVKSDAGAGGQLGGNSETAVE